MAMNKSAHCSDVSIDDEAEILALEKLLAEADENEATEKHSKSENKNIAPYAEEKPTTSSKVPRLREDSTFIDAFSVDIPVINTKFPEPRMEELDSSDEEEVKNFLERKYNEYGSDINKRLKQDRNAQHEQKVAKEVNTALKTEAATVHIKNPHNPIQRKSHLSGSFQSAPLLQAQHSAEQSRHISSPASSTFTDPVFGLRLINPLISSTALVERMSGRKPVPFSGIAYHLQRGDLSKDWVIAGVLTLKKPVRTTKKGDPYSLWTLSDLRGEIKTVTLFLFQAAHKELWKTAQGMCLAILNPTVLENNNAKNNDVACLSIDTPHKVMILGQSKDLGTCKARKKNGEPCTSIVNLGECDYCIFHMKQEYSKMSKRSELQSSTSGRGLNELRNKVLGKSEVFYGGQSFTAVPAKKSAKLTAKDKNRISALSEYSISPFSGSVNHASKPRTAFGAAVPYAGREGPVSKVAANIEATAKQRHKDLERLKILQAQTASHSSPSTSTSKIVESNVTPAASNSTPKALPMSPKKMNLPSSNTPTSSQTLFSSPLVPEKFKERSFSFVNSARKLSQENFCIEVNVGARQAQLARLNAINTLKKQPIEKVNPNSLKGSQNGKRRAIDELNDKFNCSVAKRKKMEEETREQERKSRIQRIMDATSSHTNLVDLRELEERDKYFAKLEKKEALEDKMLSTYKVPCKAVICKQCKYTAFSAADRCKEERHILKVIDAEKRFFQCKDCGNRTFSVFKMPKTSCKNCKGSRWERAAMIRDRKACNVADGLSIRGDEEVFMGSLAGNANLNLLVADEN